ncbi:hypothetical protein [Palleronia caenipelagi]|uniref:Uncharacterized protein n=1 Tax=Palleronia caenipelagi TaxID=2489174 RepID=A0A547PW64_9RHOB|nr:hypothetical protein [Palleronia caenipelagi]TRD18365.1 hypothetical protein FEV53_11965 [Palleronia caenipelagi]
MTFYQSADPLDLFDQLDTALTRMMALRLQHASGLDDAGMHQTFDEATGAAVNAWAEMAARDLTQDLRDMMAATYGGRP